MMLTVGDLLDDRYRLVESIATGGMGDVWQAADEMLGRTVAVKSLHARLIDDAGIGERFRGEARAMAALRHSGVAAVYDYGESTLPDGQDIAYIVMACVRGQPLSERIALAGRLDPTRRCRSWRSPRVPCRRSITPVSFTRMSSPATLSSSRMATSSSWTSGSLSRWEQPA